MWGRTRSRAQDQQKAQAGCGPCAPQTQGRAVSAGTGDTPIGAASQARSCETPGAQPPGETLGWRQSCYKRRGVGQFSFPATSSEALICCSCRGVGSLPPVLVSSGWLGWAQPLIKEQGAQAGAAGSPHSCTSPGKFSLQPAVPWDTRDGTLHGGEIPRNVPVAMGRWCPGSPRASGQAGHFPAEEEPPRGRSCVLGRSSSAIPGAVVGTMAGAAPSPCPLHGMKAGIVSPPAPEPEVCKQ